MLWLLPPHNKIWFPELMPSLAERLPCVWVGAVGNAILHVLFVSPPLEVLAAVIMAIPVEVTTFKTLRSRAVECL